MNKITVDLLSHAKQLLELKQLLREYHKDNPGIEPWTEVIFEYLDSQIVRNLTDVIHLERLS